MKNEISVVQKALIERCGGAGEGWGWGVLTGQDYRGCRATLKPKALQTQQQRSITQHKGSQGLVT